MTTMKSMKRSKKDKKETKGEVAIEYEEPDYPYGLGIDLADEALDSLGLTAKSFKIGNEINIVAKVRVDRISSNKSRTGKNRDSVDLQITDMGLEGAKEEGPSKFEAHQKITNSEGGVIED